MRVLVDTSAYSLFKEGHRALTETIRSANLIALTAVVLGELLRGFALGRREAQNRKDLQEFLSSPRVQVLPMGLETAERFALIARLLREIGRPIPTNDLWIAASAMEHGLRVVTTDEHFTWVPTILTEFVTPS